MEQQQLLVHYFDLKEEHEGQMNQTGRELILLATTYVTNVAKFIQHSVISLHQSIFEKVFVTLLNHVAIGVKVEQRCLFNHTIAWIIESWTKGT